MPATIQFIREEVQALSRFLDEERDYDGWLNDSMRHEQLCRTIKTFHEDLYAPSKDLSREEFKEWMGRTWLAMAELRNEVSRNGENELMPPDRILKDGEAKWWYRKEMYWNLMDLTHSWGGSMFRGHHEDEFKKNQPLPADYRELNRNMFDADVAAISEKLTALGIDPCLIHSGLAPFAEFRSNPEVVFSFWQLEKLRAMLRELAWFVREEGEKDNMDLLFLLANIDVNSNRMLLYCRGVLFRELLKEPGYARQLQRLKELKIRVEAIEPFWWRVYPDNPSLKQGLIAWIDTEEAFLNDKLADGELPRIPMMLSVPEAGCLVRELFNSQIVSGGTPVGIARAISAGFSTGDGEPIPFKPFLKAFVSTDPSVDKKKVRQFKEIMAKVHLMGGMEEFMN